MTMIVIVGECRVHFRQRQSRMLCNDLIRTFSVTFVPVRHMLHFDPVTGNVRFSAAVSR